MAEVLNVTEDTFDEEVMNSEVPVLVDFWAVWCGPCRMLAPTMEQLAEDLKGRVKVVKINVDEESDLAGKYNVMSIPTLALISGDRVLMKSIGVKPKDVILQEVEAAL